MRLTRVLVMLTAGYAIVVRPRMRRWGATVEEVESAYPGAHLVPGGKRGATMATGHTVEREPSESVAA